MEAVGPLLWYDINDLSWKHVLPLSMRVPVLRGVAAAGILIILVADWRTANRWAREREPRP